MSEVLVPHFAWPFRVEAGRVAVLEQDSTDDIAQCVQVLLSTTEGQRLEVPEYGVPEMVFSTAPDVEAAVEACTVWEPRAVLTMSDVEPESWDDLVAGVLAEVRGSNDEGGDLG